MGRLFGILSGGAAHKAPGILLATMTIALFILNLRRAGERTGRLTERLAATENANETHRQMLEAASRRPADRDALVERLRDGRF